MKAGVSHFQRTYGLPVTGAVDAKTLQSILWAYGELKIPKSPETPPVPPTPQEPGKGKEIPGLSAEERRMVELVNEERAKIGLPALAADAELSRVARIKSQDMIANSYFSHTSPTYGSPFEMMRNFGISFRTAGENIACNASVEAAHHALMQSQGHRENILNASFQANRRRHRRRRHLRQNVHSDVCWQLIDRVPVSSKHEIGRSQPSYKYRRDRARAGEYLMRDGGCDPCTGGCAPLWRQRWCWLWLLARRTTTTPCAATMCRTATAFGSTERT